MTQYNRQTQIRQSSGSLDQLDQIGAGFERLGQTVGITPLNTFGQGIGRPDQDIKLITDSLSPLGNVVRGMECDITRAGTSL